MAYLVVPQNIQKLEYDVTTAEGSGHVTVVTGMLPYGLQAYSNNATANSQSASLRALVDPKLSYILGPTRHLLSNSSGCRKSKRHLMTKAGRSSFA
jgi:hypothetical protein